MNKRDLESMLVERLAVSRGRSVEEVTLELKNGGVIDSLEGVELAIEAEQTLGIVISDGDLSSDVCQSITDLAALIGSKLGSSNDTVGRNGI